MSWRWARGSAAVVVLLLATACGARPVALRAGNVPQPDTSGVASSSPADARARSVAASLLAQVTVPPGSVLATSAVPAALDRPFEASPLYPPTTPNLVDLHTVWAVPEMGPMEVWAFMKSHPVGGLGTGGYGPSERDGITVYNDFWVPPVGSDSSGVAHPVVAEEIVGLPGGGSALRVDVQTVWLPDRSSGETVLIPGASDLSATVSVALPWATLPPAAMGVTDTAVLTMLANAFNAMPAWAPGVVVPPQCEHYDTTWSVTFTTTSPTASTVAATESTCWQVTVHVDGLGAQDLWDNAGALRGLIESQVRAH